MRIEQIEAEPGDLLLFTRAKGLNKMITMYSRSPYYHVAFYAGGPFVVEARPRGVVRRDLRGPDGDKIFVVAPLTKVSGCTREQAIAALRWAESKIGLGYDPLNVFAMVLDRTLPCWRVPSVDNERYACGEIVTQALREAGFDPLEGMDSPDVLPGDFEKYVPAGSPIYEGAPRGEGSII